MGEAAVRSMRLRGVRVHNLQGVDLDLPLGRFIVITGVSGSGKSSLAFDTLFAEGQRRYMETLSAAARQLLGPLEKPDADRIEGVPAAIAVGQASGFRRSRRSTVGSVTELDAHLATLYARLGRVSCRSCGSEVAPADPEAVSRVVSGLPAGTRYQIAFPLDLTPESDLEALGRLLRAEGFIRVRVGGTTRLLDDDSWPRAGVGSEVEVIVDRLVAGSEDPSRRQDSIETAFAKGLGRCRLLTGEEARTFTRGWRCGRCGRLATVPEPRLFRPGSPLGACPTCEGLGRVRTNRVESACPSCRGRRLRPEALAVDLGGKTVADLDALPITEVRAFLDALRLDDQPVGRHLVEPVRSRLDGLERLGLGYLSLERPARSLSTGEARRVRLAAALGSGLVNTLYVLDEPTIGLHPSDIDRVIAAIRDLRDRGNTVVVVEHEPAVMRAADLLVDIGPGAGREGGRVIYHGSPEGLAACEASATAPFLNPDPGRSLARPRRSIGAEALVLKGAAGHNLQGIDARVPLRVLAVVAGVSGAGKSTLVEETLAPALWHRLKGAPDTGLPYRSLTGVEAVADVVLVDQAPISRAPRSNPATYVGAYGEIRRTFAATAEARARHFGPSAFSFNVEGGRCSTCEGNGFQVLDMRFLPDVTIRCPECQGTRFRPELREVTYRGKNIAEVLDLTVREAFTFFRNRPKVQARLRPLIEVGLDYLRLGQPAATLSGGEAQRVKLAAYLGTSAGAFERLAAGPRTLFLLDEPTTGLHPAEVGRLLDALNRLVDLGHSVLVVENDPALIAAADWCLELGPGAGASGGRVIAEGTPEDLARGTTPTGQALREAFPAM